MVSIPKTDKETRLLEICERSLTPMGFRAVDVDCMISGRSLIRIFVEKIGTGEGASLEDCAEISRRLGTLLDVEEFIPGRYDLEVSSPGLDRRLRTSEDFEKHLNEDIKLRLREKIPGLGGEPTGKLLSVNADSMNFEVLGKEVGIPVTLIKRANLVFQFPKAK